MGLFTELPPELLTFFTWLFYLVSASAVVLVISIFGSKLLDQFIDWIIGLR